MAGRRLDELDYYALLGVARDAPADQIKRAFHDFARRYHPDRHPGDPARRDQALAIYRRGTEAYRVLNDPESRRLYGQSLADGQLRFDPSAARQARRASSRPPAPESAAAKPAGEEPVVLREPPREQAAEVQEPAPNADRPRRHRRRQNLAAPGMRSLADATSGRAREFAVRAEQAIAQHEYRSARLSLRLALGHDRDNPALQGALSQVERLLRHRPG